jgi:hypothetical protein
MLAILRGSQLACQLGILVVFAMPLKASAGDASASEVTSRCLRAKLRLKTSSAMDALRVKHKKYTSVFVLDIIRKGTTYSKNEEMRN